MTERVKIIFPVTISSVSLAEDIFEAVSNNVSHNQREGYRIRTVLSEAFSNAFLYCEKDSGDSLVEFSFCFKKGKFVASIINEGSGFADNAIKWNEFPSETAESGRGVKIIKKLADKVEFVIHPDNKFEVYMEFLVGTDEKVSK